MVAESDLNVRETFFVNLETVADGSWIKTVGFYEVFTFLEEWFDPDDWIAPPLFNSDEIKACKALGCALHDFDKLGLEDTAFVEGLRYFPQFRTVEAMAKTTFEILSVRGARPLG